ncbi:MAG: hypothetical protein LBC63_08640 [Holophagales bacterium]|jgi:hypothetical protein|nr:hypothetical protein [Holophagales bacterium]
MHQIAQKYLNSELPAPMAATLIGGGLPIPTADLLCVLSHAVFKDPPLSNKALETLADLPSSIVMGAISGPVETPDVLGLVLLHRHEPELLETALLNGSLTAEWMERAIPALTERHLEIALNNQVLWIQRPTILDALEAHPAGTTNLKRRITEFRKEVLGQLDNSGAQERIEILDDVDSGALDKAWSELPLPTEDEAQGAHGSVPQARHTAPVAASDGSAQDVQFVPPPHQHSTVAQRIMKLAPNQKIVLALRGGKEERTILMQEANRLIQVNIVRNGRITEGEIAHIAQMRTAHEDVIRIISNNREWTRKYQILKNLVFNPRTPLPIAMSLIGRVNEFDLKRMSKDRNIPDALRREAQRLVERKTAGRG